MQRAQLVSRLPDRRKRPLRTRPLIIGILLAQVMMPAAGAADQVSSEPIAVAFPAETTGAIPALVPPRQNAEPAVLFSGDGARTPPQQQRYVGCMLLGASAILLQGLLLNWLLRERGQRRRSEAEARATMSQLAHMNRVATAGELSASIAHELTQPITGMVASANAALRWLSAPTPQIDQARSALTQVVSAGDRTKEIIHGIRAMFHNDAEGPHPVDVNGVIIEVLGLVEGDLERHQIAVETELSKRSVTVCGNHIQLQQVILNLALNAIESMSQISARPRLLRICSTRNGRDVSVSIMDSGTGIPSGEAKELFKPLYTTKSQGMGMGLSICRSIIEAHKGRIWASPGDQCGAAFNFVLPATG